MNNDKKIRILLAKSGCDIHERGALTLLSVFRDAGMEVIYTGRYQSPEGIANAAVTEDVDIIALSDMTGSLFIIAKQVIAALKEVDAADIKIMAGGLLTDEDVKNLEGIGVKGNFGPGTSTDIIVEHVKQIMGGE
ncbi:MAG: methylmalonyl-CoA mutase [Firmicutes bacterium HGW-Firmicutes-12]|jgi:methylmalonyl-CoA mutase C-terminal domain/subunit|nr:MAG: methylmalonyl-CoA mutase [Firmicutes bacterium HGW-Firmicutes-12]